MAAEQLSSQSVRAVVEHTARAAYGRLIAVIAASTGDLELAEDCLADAFEKALRTWPDKGIPDNPDAWFVAVARNRQRDVWKSAARRTAVPLAPSVEQHHAAAPIEDLDPAAIGDRRLELLLVCAHPAIATAIRTPLMLQAALGFDAAQIAAAFAVPEATMAQRLVRAKRRIRANRVPFVIPDRDVLRSRLPAVLEAVYGCYAIAPGDSAAEPDSMAGEARHLAVALTSLVADEPEAWGLAALISLSLARAPATRGTFVPLEDQDERLWDLELIADGEAQLRRAARGSEPGRFELEAAIQAVHCNRVRTGCTDWAALETLHTALATVAPTLGGQVARAVVLGRRQGPDAGLADLKLLESTNEFGQPGRTFQPFHAARGDLLARAGRHREAAEAFAWAAELSRPGVEQAYLRGRAERG